MASRAVLEGLPRIVSLLRKEYGGLEFVEEGRKNPFRVLVSCILSQRTTDANMLEATDRLFRLASTPEKMARLDTRVLETAIKKAGFYHQKARHIKETCRMLLSDFDGNVPRTIDELLTLKGVGRKTANIVVTHGFGLPGIAVDTHVHRISNRLGLVRTKTPDQTETELRSVLPKRYWVVFNELLVKHGQRVCRPITPKCSVCGIEKLCKKVGVQKRG